MWTKCIRSRLASSNYLTLESLQVNQRKQKINKWNNIFLPEPEEEDNSDDADPSSTGPQGSERRSLELPAAAVEHRVEVLLAEWNKGADMLFSIHPMDGSLLVWNVDWLDEYQPAMYRQAQVGVSSVGWWCCVW